VPPRLVPPTGDTVILSRLTPLKLAVPAAAFLLTLAALTIANGSSPSAVGGGPEVAATGPSTDGRIRAAQRVVAAKPTDAGAYATLGEAYLQKVRETGDAGFYSKAEGAFRTGLQRDPREVGGRIGLGSLALARHDFRAALQHGLEARRLAPELVRPYAVIADAQVELGRYADAGTTLQRMVDMKPNLASYARVSYFRELNGDLDGAAEAMALAVSAGGDAPENVAYVQTLLGNLELDRGRAGAAEAAYRTALDSFPDHPAANAALARLEAGRGELGPAIRRYRAVVARLPLPEYVIGLAEAELAAGRDGAARRNLDLVRVEQTLLQSNGVNADVELALFEANHGSARRAVELGRRVWAAAPGVRSADALGWALTASGSPKPGLAFARRALALGSKDPTFLYHAGMSARAAGRRALAVRHLRAALAVNPRFSALYAPRAKRALRELA
jgi:tetratricopeptide (TPR) repeat protein